MNRYQIGYAENSRAIFTDFGTTVEVVGIGIPSVDGIVEDMTIEEGRALWNYLVSKGFHKATVAPTPAEYRELLEMANATIAERRWIAQQETNHGEEEDAA